MRRLPPARQDGLVWEGDSNSPARRHQILRTVQGAREPTRTVDSSAVSAAGVLVLVTGCLLGW